MYDFSISCITTMQVLIFVCLTFIPSSFAACISQSDIDNEINKIRLELNNIPADKIQDELFRIAAIARIDKRKEIGELERRIGSLHGDRKSADRMVGAVVGRGVAEAFFLHHIRKYLPDKTPEGEYTTAELDKAYTDFFNDTNNEVVKALLDKFPNRNKQELARTIRNIHGKLCSFVDDSLFETLKNMHTFDEMVAYIKALGAHLSADEVVVVEKIATVLSHLDDGGWGDSTE